MTKRRMAKGFVAVWVVLAVLAPACAGAQDVLGIPLPRIQQGPSGITIVPMPGVLPAIRVQGNFERLEPVPSEPSPDVAPSFGALVPVPDEPAPAEPPPFVVPEEPIAPSSVGRTVGVFVGISDYASASDLEHCASDAVRVQQAFVNAGIIDPMDTVVLTDHRATRAAVANAVERLARRLSPGDTLVFFFSGHGDRVSDANGDEQDGLDETILLADGPMTDDELAQLLGGGHHRELVALDSCYSGGFARDIARLGDSAGFYASREDQVSYVASEHGAGGYLSYHLAESVARSRGRPMSMWQLQSELSEGFARSGAAGRQDLTVGMSRSVNHHTVLFSREAPPAQLAASGFVGRT